jgi:hypothetical protein
MKDYSIGVNWFLKDPYDAVRKGIYDPTLLCCWSVIACNTGVFFKAWWEKICEFDFDMRLSEIPMWLLAVVLYSIFVPIMPLTFWLWGTLLYFRLKGERERHLKIQEALNRKLDGLV